jgi:tetraacyldisaccharide 4'-kinase
MSAGGIGRAVEAAWRGTSARDRLVVGALAPLAAGYRAGVAVRNALYDHAWLRAERVPARVLSVGNLTVGGSGKTPTALWLAEALGRRGRRVALVARGYGKRRPGVVVVGDGRALVDPAEGGDEAVLLAMRSGLPVVTGERRADAARAACDRFGCDTIVLDDGFQHRALARDADLVLVPAEGLPGRLLPAGPLREPPSAVARARALLALGDETGLPARPVAPAGMPVFVGRVVPCGVVTTTAEAALVVHDLASLPRDGVVAVAGVARPERFFALLERLGCRVVERVAVPDHHAYAPADLARFDGGRPVVTTEKDLVKLARLPGARTRRLAAVRIDVEVEDGERLVDLLVS